MELSLDYKGANIGIGIVIPKLISVIPNLISLLSIQILISWLIANMNPPANACPLIIHILGTFNFNNLLNTLLIS